MPYRDTTDSLFCYWTIRRIVDGLYAVKTRDGLIMALRAYFDDAGTHDGAAVCLWAGFVGRVEQWDRLDAAWKAVLQGRSLRYFHMAECEAGAGDFFMSRAARDSLIHDLRQAALQSGVTPIASAIPYADWQEATVNAPIFCGIATACLVICADQVLRFHARGDTDPVELIFDGGSGPNARQAIAELGEAFNSERDRRDHYSHVPVKQTPALQAADMYAWELHRHLTACLREQRRLPPRPHLAAWPSPPATCAFFQRADIDDWIGRARATSSLQFSERSQP